MAHMQRPRWIGRHKLHQHFFLALSLFAKAGSGMQHFLDDGLFGAGFELEV